MPLEFIKDDELPKVKRASKIERSSEWPELIAALNKGFPRGKTLKVVLSDATRKLFKNDLKKAASAFVLRLRKEFSDRYKIRMIDGDVYVSNK